MSTAGRWFRVNTTWSQSEWLAVLSPAARLAWIELLGYVKAHGYDGRVRAVSPVVFGRMVGIPAEDVTALLDAATADGALLVEDGDWCITGWKAHQGDASAADRMKRYRKKRDVTDVTRNDTVVTPTETETETIEDSNESLSGSDKPNADPAKRERDELTARRIRQVFDYWQQRCGHDRATLTKERRVKIKARLKTFTVEDLFRAIDGAAESPFHQGDNDRHTRYDWPETIFKTDAATERLMHSRNGKHSRGEAAPIIRESI